MTGLATSPRTKTLRIELPALHPGQREVLNQHRRFSVLACGRRWGKSTLGMDRLIKPALEGFPAAWFAPSYKNLAESFRTIKTALAPVIASKDETEYRLELRGGGSIVMWSLDTEVGDYVRGRAYKVAVLDEAALVKNLMQQWENAIRPTLADYQGDAWFLSTPRGINDFKVLYDRGQDPLRREWKSWRMPTITNPHIRPEEIDSARMDMTEGAFGQEFLAEFVSWEGAVFRRIEEAVYGDASGTHLPMAGQYVIGCDWGRSQDYSVFCCINTVSKRVVEIQRSNRVDYTLQRQRLWGMFHRYAPRTVVAEANSIGQPVIEQLRREGMPITPFMTTNSSKAQIVEALALAFEKYEIKIPNDPVLIAELQAFQAEPTPSGLMRYSAPAGQHDDMVMGLALAWYGITKQSGGWRSESIAC